MNVTKKQEKEEKNTWVRSGCWASFSTSSFIIKVTVAGDTHSLEIYSIVFDVSTKYFLFFYYKFSGVYFLKLPNYFLKITKCSWWLFLKHLVHLIFLRAVWSWDRRDKSINMSQLAIRYPRQQHLFQKSRNFAKFIKEKRNLASGNITPQPRAESLNSVTNSDVANTIKKYVYLWFNLNFHAVSICDVRNSWQSLGTWFW